MARGGGKSTTAEAGTVAVGARGKRKYALYVSGTQKKADDHVSSISVLLESDAIGHAYPALGRPLLNKLGTQRGWRHNRLRTESGFTVDSLGLDVDVRGAKLDENRFDLIILDDIDSSTDSTETVAKKVKIITQDILPAGSNDVAVLFIQNLVHYEGVAAQLCGLASVEADYLATRTVVGPIPALKGFQVERVPGTVQWKITRGEPTWVGQSLEACQAMLNDIGLRAFRAEAQHERTPPEGQAFPEWDQSVHVCEPFKVPEDWPRWRAVDYGYSAPYACLWFAQAPSGTIYVYRERYARGKIASDQAYEVYLASAGEKIRFSVGDPAMWASQREGEKFKSVAAQYAEMGVALQPASNDRLSGKALVHHMLEYVAGVAPHLQVFRTCTNLVRTMPMLPVDPHKPEDVDTLADDHVYDCLRYGLMAAHWLDALKRSKPVSYLKGRR